ncbi:hypothetical protein PHMEG_0006884 [Phytophthora megakarya]|uniref:Uncharacterized protein n=1 Tax=Phytophthora megakarya TaxID=4795 RepID=A0A225WMR8_9STRA|nr:hypothetical protein PHMEG_0006884 [Phytophthora megakarya]
MSTMEDYIIEAIPQPMSVPDRTDSDDSIMAGKHGPAATAFDEEEHLEVNHSEQDWAAFEDRFKETNIMVVFSIDEPTISVPDQGYWGLQELATGIVTVCSSKGVAFDSNGLIPGDTRMTALLGRPRSNDRALWIFLRQGYMKVHGVTVWVSPDFTGRKQSNLDLIELEYSNPNYVSAPDLHAVLRGWGAMEPLVVSHGRSRLRYGKWPAIACIATAVADPSNGEFRFAFRLCFECPSTAATVYQSGYQYQDGCWKDNEIDTSAERRMERGQTENGTTLRR